MEKVQRGAPVAPTVEAPADFHDKLAQATEVEDLMNLWEQAKVGGYADFVRKSISERKAIITGGKK
jgi:hypothetical protein